MSTDKPEELPSEEELAQMSRDELVKLGSKLDGVELVEYPDPWPVKGTRAEKRAERQVAFWFALSGIAGLAFVVAFIWWPARYVAPDEDGYLMYSLYTPVIGVHAGPRRSSPLGIGVLNYTRKFIPHELAVQQRHDGGSSELDKATILANLADAGNRSTIARRPMIKRSLRFGGGVLGLALTALPLGSLLRNPHAQSANAAGLIHTPWQHTEKGEKVYLRRATGGHEISLVRPEDMDAGAMDTVFPYRKTDSEDDWHKVTLLGDSAVMLIRLRPQDGAKVIKHEGQEDFNYGDYYAYTKICSHLGCPTSLYEQRTNRILCPCHQSQFDALQYAKPVFGPATRKLAQLPITVDEDGYFISTGDFIEPVGPAYWERKS